MKTVIEMAREAELVYWMDNFARTNGRWWMDAGEPGDELERFAELVRADEREACSELVYNSPPSDEYESPLMAVYKAIRARGQK